MFKLSNVKTFAVAAAIATGLAGATAAQANEEPQNEGPGVQGPINPGPQQRGINPGVNPGPGQGPIQGVPGVRPQQPGQQGLGRPVYATPRSVFVGKWILTDQRGRRVAVVFGPRGRFVISGGPNAAKVVGLYSVRGSVLMIQAKFVCNVQGCMPRQARPVIVRYRVINGNIIQTSNGTLQRAQA